MSTPETPKEVKTHEKCTCTKSISKLEKEIAVLRAEIALLRSVLKGGK